MFIRWLLLKIRKKDDFPLVIVNLCEFAVYFLLLSFIFAICIKFTENISWNEAVWQVWQTATTVGFGNKPASTLAGRHVTIFFGIISIAILGVVISSAVDLKLMLSSRRKLGMLDNPFKGGYVLFNFPGHHLELYIREIVAREPEVGICVVDSRLEELPLSIRNLHNKIRFVKGYSHDQETYKRAGLRENKKVVVFPLDPVSPESDLSTSRLVDLVLRFVEDSSEVIYVLLDSKNEWMFPKKAVPVLQNLNMLAIVQECQNTHSSAIIRSILLNTEGAYTHTVTPQLVVGKQWGEIVKKSMSLAVNEIESFNLLALIRCNKIMSCPKASEVIKQGDRISIIANSGFKWNNIEKKLS